MKHLNLALVLLLLSIPSFAVLPSPITGRLALCQADTTHLNDATSGGTWTSGSPSIASVGAGTGIVTGIATGTAVISYTTSGGTVTATVTVNPTLTQYTVFIAGSGSICPGAAGVHIYLSGSQTPGYTYQLYMAGSPIGSPVAGTGGLVDFGLYNVPGTYTATGTITATGCSRAMNGSAAVTTLPAPGTIGGPSSVCVAATASLTNSVPGGTWASSNTAIATVGTSGVVTGITAGSVTITYTLSSGCSTTTALSVINTIAPISGPGIACTASATTLTDATSGGTWVSTNPSVATIGSSSGIVSGLTAGTTTISYTVSGGCGAAATVVSVHATPGAITGITGICQGAVSTLHDASIGGAWSSSNTSIVTIGTGTGIANGVSAGSATISYTVAGCSATTTMNIDPRPVITGPTTVCAAASATLYTSINGSWTSSNTAVATIVSGVMTGTVTGVYPGTTVITCNSYSTGCVSTYTVNVTSSCTGTPTAGTAHASLSSVCSGNADLLYLTGYTSTCGTSYQWQSSTDSTAWAAIPATNHDSLIIHPQSTLYYRCKLTCFSTGLFSYSAGTRVAVYNNITTHSVLTAPSTTCTGPDMHVAICGIAPATNLVSYFGDGTQDSTHLASILPDSSASADIFHQYAYPGVYTVKQLLRAGVTGQDSATFSYAYNHCRTLPVFFYYDANSNCIFDLSDGRNNHPVTTVVDSNGIAIDTITSLSGFYYRALGDTGTIYRFRVITYDTGLHLSCPGTGIVYDTITSFMNTYVTRYVGFSCATSSAFNLGIQAGINCSATRATGEIDVNNKFCSPQSAVVTMTFSPKYNFSSSSPAPFSVSGHTAIWHISPLTVYNAGTFPVIRYTLAAATTLTAGDTVNSSFTITPTTGDLDTADNYVNRIDTIKASLAANIMSVSPRSNIISCSPLQYTISFTNTGSAAVTNLAVVDTLSDNVDPRTIKVVSASAAMNMAIQKYSGHTVVKFDFPGINLPDSSHHNDCAGSVVFTVKAKSGLADGTVIYNRAGIYMDNNKPVLTNTVGNTIGVGSITGPSTVCFASHIQLSELTEMGAWSSSNGTATVVNGLVTGMGAGIDTIRYTLSNSCGSKVASKVITINPVVVPAVTITTNTGTGDSVCSYDDVTLTAHPVNGGAAPTYKWLVNGALTAASGATFFYSTPVNNDHITVVMTSNIECPLPDTGAKTETLIVLDPYAPPISLDVFPGIFIHPGEADTFVANVGGSGPMPTFQWLLNGAPLPGETNNTYISSTLSDGDSVTIVTTGADICHLSTFNSVTISVGNVSVQRLNRKGAVALFPNPNNGTFTIKGMTGLTGNEPAVVEVANMLGQVVYHGQLPVHNGIINQQLHPGNLAKGSYLLNLRAGPDRVMFRFVVE